MRASRFCGRAGILLALVSVAEATVVIDNGLSPTESGYFAVEVGPGGTSNRAIVTGERSDNTSVSQNVLGQSNVYLQLFSDTLDIGQTVTMQPTLTGPREVTSAGSFIGTSNNVINWTAVSTLPDGSNRLSTTYTFTPEEGQIGELSLIKYLDGQPLAGHHDVVVRTGSSLPISNTLDLFTIDAQNVYGLGQSGQFDDFQPGLENAFFSGWRVGEVQDLLAAIKAGTATFDQTSGPDTINADPNCFYPELGFEVFGPLDVASAMEWVFTDAESGVVTTMLVAVPNADAIPDGVGAGAALLPDDGCDCATKGVIIPLPPAVLPALTLMAWVCFRYRR